MKTPDNLSQTDADELMKNVTETQNNLVYSTRNRELAELETKNMIWLKQIRIQKQVIRR